jgi:glycosyltransferase involved in cell wall biosynthesis
VHLVALVESADHVCARYRLAALRPYLERAGHTLELLAWPRHWWARLALPRELRHADLVIVQRRLLSAAPLVLLRRAVGLLAFDFDDAVFLRDSYAAHGQASFFRRRRFARMIRAADAVVTGNVFLSVQATRYTAPDRVHVIPTCVDPGRYPLAKHERQGDGTQLVWVGSASTLRGLEVVRPLLEEIGLRCPEVCLKLICDKFVTLQRLPVVPCRWSEASEAAEIAAADIGLSWVPDDSWSRGKCGLKVLQYMAAGLPVIANPVGVQAEMVQHGESGFLCETADQWVEAVRRLVHDPDLRRRMGEAGRQRVETDFHVGRAAILWLGVLEQLQQGEPGDSMASRAA